MFYRATVIRAGIRCIDILGREKLVTRTRDGSDARRSFIDPSERGREIMALLLGQDP